MDAQNLGMAGGLGLDVLQFLENAPRFQQLDDRFQPSGVFRVAVNGVLAEAFLCIKCSRHGKILFRAH
jgi:hypothetical protein